MRVDVFYKKCARARYICGRDRVFISIRKTADMPRAADAVHYNGKGRTHTRVYTPHREKHALASKFSCIKPHCWRTSCTLYIEFPSKNARYCGGEPHRVYACDELILAAARTRQRYYYECKRLNKTEDGGRGRGEGRHNVYTYYTI